MSGVLVGFTVIGVIVLAGYILARTGIMPNDSKRILNDVAFFAASPALLFTVMARADVQTVFSSYLLNGLLANIIIVALYLVLARLFLTRDPVRLAIGATASAYANANNIGLPISLYVLGDAQYVAPLLLMQVVFIMPIVLLVLDVVTSGKVSVGRILTQPFRAPIVFGSALGVVVALTGWEVPAFIWNPLEILGGAAVPMMLIAFGASLHGEKAFQQGSGRREVMLATAMKSAVLPLVAYLLARFVMDLEPQLVFAATVIWALPTAQNVYQFSLRYNAAPVLSRDVILITTFLSFPVVLLIAALIHP